VQIRFHSSNFDESIYRTRRMGVGNSIFSRLGNAISRRVINRVIATFPSHISRNTVIVVDGFDSLPPAIRKVAEQQGYDHTNPNERINGVTYQGKIYIVHGNVQ
jgi:hypothetical protein